MANGVSEKDVCVCEREREWIWLWRRKKVAVSFESCEIGVLFSLSRTRDEGSVCRYEYIERRDS